MKRLLVLVRFHRILIIYRAIPKPDRSLEIEYRVLSGNPPGGKTRKGNRNLSFPLGGEEIQDTASSTGIPFSRKGKGRSLWRGHKTRLRLDLGLAASVKQEPDMGDASQLPVSSGERSLF